MLIKHYNLHCGSFPSLQKLFLDMSCILTSDLTCWQVRAGNASRSGQVTCPAQGVQVQGSWSKTHLSLSGGERNFLLKSTEDD